MKIHSVFPEPVYFSKLEREITQDELKTVDEYKKKTFKNEGNLLTHDTDILENKTLKNLKKDLHKIVVDYFDKVVCTSNSLIPYITQSWISYTETNQFHHRHAHANSYVSGVLYIAANKKVDRIKFYKEKYDRISLEYKKFNEFNSANWWFAVETGYVVLFPSNLTHGVDNKKGTNCRISLAFNVFIKGEIGANLKLTELVLK
jgi:uncharacterized protein (TIGR02466 family)